MILATLCYVKDRSRFLMLHRNKRLEDLHFGKWNGLGGKVQSGETPEECAVREVWEESTLVATKLQFNGVVSFPKFDGQDDWYVFVYTVSTLPGEPIAGPEGSLHWVESKKVLALNLWEGDRVFLPYVFEGVFFSAKLIYENGGLKDSSVIIYGPVAEAAPAPLLHSCP